MNRKVIWLSALICAGWFSSAASAWTWPPFAGLRHGTCTNCSADQGTQVVTDQSNIPPGAIVNGGVGCHAGLGLGNIAGYIEGIPQHVTSAARSVNQWILNVPRKTSPPPKQFPINPYTRSPRDFFMMDDP